MIKKTESYHEEIPFSNKEFYLFQKFIYQESGIYLSPVKKDLVFSRLHRRLRFIKINSFKEYYEIILQNNEEKIQMLNCICTHETRFFREDNHFCFLEEKIIPEWKKLAIQGKRSRKIRVWSAGCSTGEEAYSLAMVFLAGLPKEEGWEIEIVATDLSTNAITEAENAIYNISQSYNIPKQYLKTFMLRGVRKQAGKMTINDNLREVVHFSRLNLYSEINLLNGLFDLVFCRNVLIYFDTISKEKVINQVSSRLMPRGYFFLGHAESLHMVTNKFKTIGQNVYIHS